MDGAPSCYIRPDFHCFLSTLLCSRVDSTAKKFLKEINKSLRMVMRTRKARARKSSEASESRGEAGEKAPLSSFLLGQFALSSPAELRLD